MLQPYRPKRNQKYITQKKVVFNLNGGLDFTLPPSLIEERFLSGCKNIYLVDGELTTRPGYNLFGSNLPLDSTIVGFDQFIDYDGSEYLICFTTKKVYKYNKTTTNWDDITDSDGNYTSDVYNKFSTEMIYDDNEGLMKFIATNQTNNIKKWTGSGNWSDLGGNPNRARFMINFNHYLMLFDLIVSGNRFPQRIDWCDQGLPETWSGGSSGTVNLAKTSDFIMAAEIIKGKLAILKEHSITICSFVGGVDPFVFEEKKIQGIGCIARNTVISRGTDIVFMGWDNIYSFDGFSCLPIGNKIAPKLFSSLNHSKVDMCCAHLIEELSLYVLLFPKIGSDFPNAAWIWDYKKNVWFYWELANEITYTGYYTSYDTVTIGTLLDKIGTLNWRIGKRGMFDSVPSSLIGDKDGYIYSFDEFEMNDNGTPIRSEIETKSFYLSGPENYSKLIETILYAKGNCIEVLTSPDDGLTYNYQGNFFLDSDNILPRSMRKFNQTSEKVMFKFQSDDYFKFRGMNIQYMQKGIKKSSSGFGYVIIDNDDSVIVDNKEIIVSS